jgi:hypothetical protein
MTDTNLAPWIAEQNRLQPIREAYFRLVADKHDWKAPIDAFVPATIDLDAVRDAVVHFTATMPDFTLTRDGWRVQAAGYRRGPAGR